MGLFEGLLLLTLYVASHLHPPPTGDPHGPLIDGAGMCGEPIAVARSVRGLWAEGHTALEQATSWAWGWRVSRGPRRDPGQKPAAPEDTGLLGGQERGDRLLSDQPGTSRLVRSSRPFLLRLTAGGGNFWGFALPLSCARIQQGSALQLI